MDQEKNVEALRAELEIEKAKLKALQDQLNPPPKQPSTHPRFDPTEGMSMPASAMKAMIDAVPESVMRGLRADALKRNPVTGGAAPAPQAQQRGSGWIEERPLEPPPGIALADRLMDHQDKIDRAELALKLAKMELGKAE
jgi:hypothetical protein